MFEILLKPLANYMMANQTTGAFIAGLIACAESMAIIGTIIPGSITMTLIGTLIGSGVLHASLTFSYILIGAFIGDYASYWAGAHYQERIKEFSIVKRYIKWFDAGEKFIKKHGVKSIIIGRFFGPMRSMVPLVAGVLGMSRWKFILGALPSVLLWAVLYLTPGILLGAFALEMPADLAMQFIALILTVLIAFTLAMYLLKRFIHWLHAHQQGLANQLWAYMKKHPNGFSTQLFHCDQYGALQVLKALYAIVFFILSATLLTAILNTNTLTHYDMDVFHLMQNLYNPGLYKAMVFTTFLGEKQVLIPVILCVVATLCWRKSYRCAQYLFTSTVVICIAIELTKYIVLRPRPILSSIFSEPYSFPSGHTALATATYVFLATVLCHHMKSSTRQIIYKVVACIIVCIGLSRLYLYAHWLSDVLFGASLGLTVAIVSSILYHRKPCSINIKPIIHSFLLSFVVCYTVYAHNHYHAYIDSYVPIQYPQENIRFNKWWGTAQDTDHFRDNIWGQPIYPLNIQWLGSQEAISTFLTEHHWKHHVVQDSWGKRLIHLIDEPSLHILPLFSQTYQGQKAAMVYSIRMNDKTEIILKLWPSSIQINQDTLWIGSIYTNPLPDHLFAAIRINKQPPVFNAYQFMQPYSPTLQLYSVDLSDQYHKPSQIPKHIQHTTWDKHILQLCFTSKGEDRA
jgi:membrane protein DedA with SNARE-associated domain/membrane-associated phospholipid phosphatase